VREIIICEVFMNIVFKSLLALVAVTGIVATAAPATYATTASTCVDGSVRSNLVVTWKTNGSVIVGTASNKPLCNDVTLFFSSYTMPDNYNGQPFIHNPTASPQAIFDNATAVMKKGEAKVVALNIKLPESCKNTQVDVYYAPKITTVGTNGHGEQYISGKIIKKTQNECTPVTPPVTPEVPTPEAQTPETPAPEVIIPATEMPAEMPKTGPELAGTVVTGTVLSAATYAGLLVRNKRR
jgi:hypothetical protein